MTSYESWLADQVEAHDNPPCAACGTGTPRSDLDDDGRCEDCGPLEHDDDDEEGDP